MMTYTPIALLVLQAIHYGQLPAQSKATVPKEQKITITPEAIDSLPVSTRGGYQVPKQALDAMDRLSSKSPSSPQMAAAIASAYFEHVFGSCGATSEPIDKVSYWQFDTRVGFAAQRDSPILVNKLTGQIDCVGHESFNSYLSFHQHLLTAQCTRTSPLRGAAGNFDR